MIRVSGYASLYFLEPVRNRQTEIERVIRLLADFFPESPSLMHVGRRPSVGRFKRWGGLSLDKILASLREADTNDPEWQVHVSMKTAPNGTFVSDWHAVLWGANEVYIPSQRMWLPNFIQLYFPVDLGGDRAFVRALSSLFREAFVTLNGCYAYVNPVVMYNMYDVAEDNQAALELLRLNPVLDIFDDFNSIKDYVEGVKTPMWLQILSKRHLKRLSKIEALMPRFAVSPLGSGAVEVRMEEALSADPSPRRLDAYKELATWLSPVHQMDFDPVCLEFPYRFPRKYSKRWIRRFVDHEDWASQAGSS